MITVGDTKYLTPRDLDLFRLAVDTLMSETDLNLIEAQEIVAKNWSKEFNTVQSLTKR